MYAVKSVAAASKRSCVLTGTNKIISYTHSVKQQAFMKNIGKIKKKKKEKSPISEVTLPRCLFSQQQYRTQFRCEGDVPDHMPPISNCSHFTPLQPLKICKNSSVTPYTIQLTCRICMHLWLCSRIYSPAVYQTKHNMDHKTTSDLSKSSFLILFLNCFLVRTPTLSGRNKNRIFVTYFENEKAIGKIQA